MNSTEQLKAVFPVLILNFIVLAFVIFFTTEKNRRRKNNLYKLILKIELESLFFVQSIKNIDK